MCPSLHPTLSKYWPIGNRKICFGQSKNCKGQERKGSRPLQASSIFGRHNVCPVCPTVDQSTASYAALDISTNENAALNIMGCFIAFGWQQWLGFSTPSRKDTSIGSVYRGKLISGNKITAS